MRREKGTQRPWVILCLALLLVPAVCAGFRRSGALTLRRAMDCAQFLVAGVVIDTEEFDPRTSDRVSLIRVDRVLFGEVSDGDTLSVAWSTGRDVSDGGVVRVMSDPGPQLSALTDIRLWLLGERHGHLECATSSIQITDPGAFGDSAVSVMSLYLERAREAATLESRSAADSYLAQLYGCDRERGELIRRALIGYLAGRIDASSEE